MIEQGKFLEVLKEIMEIAKTQDNSISKEELRAFLGNAELSEQQMESVYAYLAENKVKVQGFTYVPKALDRKEVPENEKISEEDSVYLKMYQEDLAKAEHLTEGRKEELFQMFVSGDKSIKQHLINGYLHDVLSVAKKYKNKGVTMEDLIQEGNIGLITALSDSPIEYEGSGRDYVIKAIESAIVAAVDEVSGDAAYENAIVAKANLIHEAAKYLEEDLGRAPSMKELEDYTKIPEDEIRDIIHLSKE